MKKHLLSLYQLRGESQDLRCAVVTARRACKGYYLSDHTNRFSRKERYSYLKGEEIEAMRSCMREKKIYCGDNYLEVDIFPYTFMKTGRNGRRSKKEKVSAPKQRNLNDKNARRYLVQKVKANFDSNDLYITLTYQDKFLPATLEEAEKIVENFLKRMRRRRRKEGLEDLKYILVTECEARIHHHLIINGGLDREVIQALWCMRRKKGEEQGEFIGLIQAQRLKPSNNRLEALCNYLSKDPKGKKRWSASKKLKSPVSRTNDCKYSKREIERIAKSVPDSTYWEKKYKGWILDDGAELKVIYNENVGWSIYAKMCKKE